MGPMDFNGCVMTSQASIHDRMDAIMGRFFLTRDVAKSKRSISFHGILSCNIKMHYCRDNYAFLQEYIFE